MKKKEEEASFTLSSFFSYLAINNYIVITHKHNDY